MFRFSLRKLLKDHAAIQQNYAVLQWAHFTQRSREFEKIIFVFKRKVFQMIFGMCEKANGQYSKNTKKKFAWFALKKNKTWHKYRLKRRTFQWNISVCFCWLIYVNISQLRISKFRTLFQKTLRCETELPRRQNIRRRISWKYSWSD